LSSEVALAETEISRTDRIIPRYSNCSDDEVHIRHAAGPGDFNDDIEESDAIPTASRGRQATTALEMFDMGPSDVNGSEGDNGYDADQDEEEKSSHADDESTQNVED
jgi:hypothetical protein